MFYKEGQKEELACLAAPVVATLVGQKRISLKQLHSAVKDRRLWLKLALNHLHWLTNYNYISNSETETVTFNQEPRPMIWNHAAVMPSLPVCLKTV